MSDEFDDSTDDFNVDVPPEESDASELSFDFDQLFLQGLLRLALEDDIMCTQLVKYLATDKDFKKVDFFEIEEFNLIFQMIVEGVKKYKKRPSEAQMRQRVLEVNDPIKVKSLNQALNLILKTDVSDEEFFREKMVEWISQKKGILGVKKMHQLLKQKKQVEFNQILRETVDKVNEISFEKDTIFKLDDFNKLYTENKIAGHTSIPTGITKLDRDTLGGLPRQGLTIVLAGTNVGKSMFCASLGVNALKAKDQGGMNLGLKVLHINLEGRINQIIFRYLSNLAQIPYEKIKLGILDEDEQARMNRITAEYSDRFMIKNLAGGFNNTIESLEAQCKEIYKKFKFDLLIVDYGQLLKTNRSNDEYRHIMSDVFRGLDTMSKAFNCACVSPAQGTRNAQEKQNPHSFAGRGAGPSKEKAPVMRSHDISEAFEIARVADMILSLNATDDEKVQNRLRVFLEKQRDGKKDQTYGLNTRFDLCDLITGSFYDPAATMMRDPEVAEMVRSLDEAMKEATGVKGGVKVDSSSPEGQMDELINLFKDETKKENSSKADYNKEKSKPEDKRNMDILEQLSQNMKKHANKKSDIMSKAQELIKKIDPNANDSMLKDLESSLRDLIKSGAPDDSIQEQTRVVNRYSLGIKGKLFNG